MQGRQGADGLPPMGLRIDVLRPGGGIVKDDDAGLGDPRFQRQEVRADAGLLVTAIDQGQRDRLPRARQPLLRYGPLERDAFTKVRSRLLECLLIQAPGTR